MDKLINDAKKGDPHAFQQLMQAQMQNMYKAASSILHNEEDVADAISETILTCWEKLKQLREEKYFRTWMTRILINKCNDIIHKNKNLYFTSELTEATVIDRKLDHIEWRAVLGQLDERYRLPLILYYLEEFKTSEISHILDIPESTVRTRLARGREQLADKLDIDRRKTV